VNSSPKCLAGARRIHFRYRAKRANPDDQSILIFKQHSYHNIILFITKTSKKLKVYISIYY